MSTGTARRRLCASTAPTSWSTISARIKVAWETGDGAGPLPSALERQAEIRDRLRDKTAAVFLDYDGTLTPIVARPELAVLGEPMRQTLRELARHTPVAVVSGRDVQDVRRLVGLDDLVIAGCHGFDIAGPEGQLPGFQEGVRFLPEIDAAESELRLALHDVSGVLIERKKFSVAVHYRAVGDADLDTVREAVNETLRTHPRLRKLAGKKVFDLQPDIDWDKGKAVDWLLAALRPRPAGRHTALYRRRRHGLRRVSRAARPRHRHCRR